MDNAAFEPDLAICDPHHHVAYMGYSRDDLLADLAGGHRVVSTVFAECGVGYRTDGPEHLRSIGETESVLAQDVPDGVMAGIIGAADLRLGDTVQEVLDAYLAVAPKRFRGVRFSTAWDPDPAFLQPGRSPTMLGPAVHRGVKAVGRSGLVMDCWVNWHQLDDVVDLARAHPDQPFVLNHLGGPLPASTHVAPEEIQSGWRENLRRVAACGNVALKLGGMGMERSGIPWSSEHRVPNSEVFADHWGPVVTWCIETFGPDRCMFESNFPVDRATIDYTTLWNAFKLMCRGYTTDERAALLRGTAERIYGIAE